MPHLTTWVSIPATDLERAVAFYASVLDTKLDIVECDDERMACFDDDVGCLVQSPKYKPAAEGAIVSLGVHDLNAALARAERAGAKTLVGKTRIETEQGGHFALLSDTEGNTIGLHKV